MVRIKINVKKHNKTFGFSFFIYQLIMGEFFSRIRNKSLNNIICLNVHAKDKFCFDFFIHCAKQKFNAF